MQCFHEFASMWTVNANYKNNFFSDIFRAAFQRVCETFLRGFQSVSTIPSVSMHFKRVSKEFQSVSKGFPEGFKAFQKGFRPFQKGFQRVSKHFKRVSKGFPKGFKASPKSFKSVFKPSETRFLKGFRVTSNPLKNAFVNKTCFRMEGHICFLTRYGMGDIFHDLLTSVSFFLYCISFGLPLQH